MNKPSQARIDLLCAKLRSGETLTVGDRMVALWFINEAQGWPNIDAAQADAADKAIEDWINLR